MNDLIIHYVANKKWYWYAALWLLCLYVFVASIGFNSNTNTSFVIQVLYTVQFGVHEVSHLATTFLPAVFTAAAGSLSEILLTGTFVAVALYSKAYFSVAFSLVWFMLACQSAGMYMSDARSQQLQLIGFGEKVTHDWNFVFSNLGILGADTTIGTTVKIIGMVAGLVGLAFGLWLIYRMMTYKKPQENTVTTPLAQYVDPSDAIAAAREAELNELKPRVK